ncbi:MAG: hypothetical protein OXP12_09145 [Thaumarchaeota archaeon]|nr:hypothetical protein [Nitrososphaerota archaeon]MDE0527067.1 hypothetical protein [Nitrososphaerota archaeon]
MSELELVRPGYVCAPYMHTHESIELKESWKDSENIESMFFVTGTFSADSKPYFTDTANHYLLAKFKNGQEIERDVEGMHSDPKRTFVFDIRDDLFEREVEGETNFVSIYYWEYKDDASEIASLLLRREKIARAGIGSMKTFSPQPPRFDFPYSNNIVVIEVASEKSYQSVNKYCDQTRREINRRGFSITNMMSLSILDRLK